MNMPTPKNQFTAGKWEACADSIICGEICIAVIETDGGYEAPSEQREANKALLVSAPALFAALQKLVADGECYCPENLAVKGPCPHCEARAALALAQKEN